MLVIRMQRVGRKNDPAFRVVLTEKRSKPKSDQQEILGSYHPKTKGTVLKDERISYWVSKGAQVSASVHHLLKNQKMGGDKKTNAAPLPLAQEGAKEDGILSFPAA